MAHYSHIIPSETYSTPVGIGLAPFIERLSHELIESVREMAIDNGMDEAIIFTLAELNAAIHEDESEGHYGAMMINDYLGGLSYKVKLATMLRTDRVLRRYARLYLSDFRGI